MLEDTIGAPVLGYRAASYSITAESLWALDILCDLGFRTTRASFRSRTTATAFPARRRGPA